MDHYRIKLEQALEQFKQDALAKYDRGRKEHNEDISQLDFNKEIKNELLDIINYILLRDICKKNTSNHC